MIALHGPVKRGVVSGRDGTRSDAWRFAALISLDQSKGGVQGEGDDTSPHRHRAKSDRTAGP